jgi:hypothetical protein
MSWSPVSLQWPAQATQWLDGLNAARALASGELDSTATRLGQLEGLAKTNPGPVAALAQAGVDAGRQAMAQQLGQTPACIAISPFQTIAGQHAADSQSGYQRFLSAPNLLRQFADRVLEVLNEGDQCALAVMFLSTRYDQLAAALANFNAVLPVPELVRTQRRALHLSRLEAEKWELPNADAASRWQPLPLERCTVTKAAKQALSGQLALLEGYIADGSPMGDLQALSERKHAQSQQRDQQLQALKDQFAQPGEQAGIRAQLIGPGTPAELRSALLASSAPGHEWVLCAGMMLVGPPAALSFAQELLGL